jgi:hypothetical protein
MIAFEDDLAGHHSLEVPGGHDLLHGLTVAKQILNIDSTEHTHFSDSVNIHFFGDSAALATLPFDLNVSDVHFSVDDHLNHDAERVSEPSALLLFGSGLVGLLMFGRRRNF